MMWKSVIVRICMIVSLAVSIPSLVASAQGGTWVTGLNIQNISSDQEASIRVDFFDTTGGSVAFLERTGILPGGGTSIYLPSESTIPYGTFSGVVASDQPVAAVVNNVNRDLRAGDSYMGTADADLSQLVYAPLVFRNRNGYSSTIYLQNAHTVAQVITVSLFPNGASTPAVTKTYTVEANASAIADLSSADYSAFGESVFGAATVEGALGPVAAVVTYFRDKGTGPAAMVSGQYRGMASDNADTELYAPMIYKRHNSWDSGISVVNTTDASSQVTVTLTASEQSAWAGTTVELTQVIDGREGGNFYLPDYAEIPSPGFYGSAKITSEQPVLVIVNSVNYDTVQGAVGSCYGAVTATEATSTIAGPLVFRAHADTDTGINIQNIGTGATTATMVFHRSGSTEEWSFSIDVPAGGAGTFYLPALMPTTTGVYGSATVSATNDSPILAVFTAPSYARGLSANYVGINVTATP